MVDKKECKIVQDLFPNYIENLTTEATNEYIENHIKGCEECRNILNNLKGDLYEKENQELKKQVNYLKKVKRKMTALKLATAIIMLIIAFALAIYIPKFQIIHKHIDKVMEAREKDNSYCAMYRYNRERADKNEMLKNKGDIITKSNGIANRKNDKLIIHGSKTLVSGNTYTGIENFYFPCLLDNSMGSRILEEIKLAIFSSIKNVRCNKKDCYEISVNTKANSRTAWIDIETGLIIKQTGTTTGTATNEYLEMEEFDFSFDKLTNEDMELPEIADYRIITREEANEENRKIEEEIYRKIDEAIQNK